MAKSTTTAVARPRKGDFETFTSNPFMAGMQITTAKRMLTVARGSKLTDVKTGQEELTTTVAQVKWVDDDKFVKVFSGQIKLYFDLTQPGFKVFMLLLQAVQKHIGVDKVWLSFSGAQKAAASVGFSLSRAVFDRGIIDLYEKKVLAPAEERDWHYINPAVVFNGDRAQFVTEFRKKSSMSNQDQQTLLPGFEDIEDVAL